MISSMKAPIIALAGLLLLSCAKEMPMDNQVVQGGKQVTIRVSMPETSTKVAFTPEEDRLALSWEEGDCIRVISGSASSVFTVSRIISAHEAEFTGPEVAGSSFEILCPGTYASVDEATNDTGLSAQNGNGSADHLRFKALLSGVDNYTDIAFKASWAEEHGGSFKQGAAVKLQANLPAGVSSLKKANLRLNGVDYALPLENVDVSASDQVLTAYMMLPWSDIPLTDGSAQQVYVTDAGDEVYSAAFTVRGEKTILPGRMNSIVGVNLSLQDFVGGDGTEENPYLIANSRQLENMMELYKNAEDPSDKNSFKYWFRLLQDVDASSIGWTPLNATGSFWKAIDFDGCGHTVSGLKATGTYASFAGVLYGSVRNVVFDGAEITGTTKKGVVAGFLGTTGLPGSCENVTVRNSSVTGTNYSGGFAGHTRTTGSIVSCRVENTTVQSSSGHTGGFTAYVDITGDDKYEVPARFTDCHVVNVTVRQDYTGSTELYTGGFIGATAVPATFTDCSAKATVTAGIKDVGGFVGRTTGGVPNFRNCHVLDGSTVTSGANHVGGFVGYSEVAASFTDCSSAADVTNTSEYTGGFAGYSAGASTFTGCTASGNVSGSAKHVGGFVGTAENSAFTDCTYEKGTVTDNTGGKSLSGGFCGAATTGVNIRGCQVKNAAFTGLSATYVGGFIGQLGASYNGNNGVSVSQCHVEKTAVTGSTNCGGFVGVQYGPIESSYVDGGVVTAKGAHCGGFSGFVQNGDLTNCYTTARVEGGSYAQVGGMIGIAYTSAISYCYSAGTINASGADRGAFVGQCAQQNNNPTAVISDCIGWNASLPFCGTNTVGATITDCYAGTDGTVSAHAQEQTWPTSVWNLGGSFPTLLETPLRIPAIFIGDSITWQWARTSRTDNKSNILIPLDPLPSYMTLSGDNVITRFHPGFFTGNGYLDKGVSGQNTTQMLTRFQEDIIDLNPQVVVIMGGTNDLAQGVTKEQIVANIAAMAEMADAAGIKVVICTVTPNNDSYSRLNDPKTKGAHIIALNGMLEDYTASKGFTWCNYWSSLVADDGLAMDQKYWLYDHLHPNPDAYTVMEKIIKPIIDQLR